MTNENVVDAHAELRRLAEAATPGPWHVVYGDDNVFQCMTAISNNPKRTGNAGQFGDDEELVAVTYHQYYPVVDQDGDDCGDANSAFIAAANPAAILALLDELESLRHAAIEHDTLGCATAKTGVYAAPASPADSSMPKDMAQAKRWVVQLRARVDSLLAVINAPASPASAPVAPTDEIAGVNLAQLLQDLEVSHYDDSPVDLAFRCADSLSVIKGLLSERVALAAPVAHDQAQSVPGMRSFVDSVIDSAFDACDLDGGTIQQWAEESGLLRATVMTEPCGEGDRCRCAETSDFPLTCYRKTYRAAPLPPAATPAPELTDAWQPMATAPKDGTCLMLHGDGRTTFGN